MSWIWVNLFFGLIAVAFTVGLPLWVMLKYPEGDAPEVVARRVDEPQRPSALVPERGVLVP